MKQDEDVADDLICQALRAEHPSWPWAQDASSEAAKFQERVDLHGAEGLLLPMLHDSNWPAPVLQDLRSKAVRNAMWELRHQQLLGEALAVIVAAGVQPVLIKGTALAYSLYADPSLRTRGDTDFIIPTESKQLVHDALLSLGFERGAAISGEFVQYQASFTRHMPEGATHTFDVHWKINNSELLSRLFTYDELRQDAQPLPQLSRHALGACNAHALLLACMHRATHKQNPYFVNGLAHYTADRLVWLFDIHLLAGRLTPAEWDTVVRLATQKGLCLVSSDGLSRAHTCLGTTVPVAVLEALRSRKTEAAARYLESRKLTQQWIDFRALGSMRSQIRYAREVFFPPRTYMRHKYRDAGKGWLPWLYVRRAAEGVAKAVGNFQTRH